MIYAILRRVGVNSQAVANNKLFFEQNFHTKLYFLNKFLKFEQNLNF